MRLLFVLLTAANFLIAGALFEAGESWVLNFVLGALAGIFAMMDDD